jgi:CheY-like chemotaxis protein
MSWQNDPASENKDKIASNPKPMPNFPPEAAMSSCQEVEVHEEILSSNNASYCALIVDDNVSFQKLLALSLSMHPQIREIDCVNSGELAIEKAEAKIYDLIFMDAMMPGIDGYEACSRLRENPKYKSTPIIMVTGLDSPSDEVRGVIAGTTTYVTKPVQQLPFKETLTKVLIMLDARNKLQHIDNY